MQHSPLRRILFGTLCLACCGWAAWISRAAPVGPPGPERKATPAQHFSEPARFGESLALADDAKSPVKGRLDLSIVDDSTGKPTPARVEVRDEKGRFFVADNPLPTGTFVFYNFDAGEA